MMGFPQDSLYELCFITFFICDKIEAIDIETDSDYQIWKNS